MLAGQNVGAPVFGGLASPANSAYRVRTIVLQSDSLIVVTVGQNNRQMW